jgi:hypothetical protein
VKNDELSLKRFSDFVVIVLEATAMGGASSSTSSSTQQIQAAAAAAIQLNCRRFRLNTTPFVSSKWAIESTHQMTLQFVALRHASVALFCSNPEFAFRMTSVALLPNAIGLPIWCIRSVNGLALVLA